MTTMDPMMPKEHHPDGDFAGTPWVDVHEYHSPHTQSPAHEFHGFGFLPAGPHGLPNDPGYSRGPVPMYSHPPPAPPSMVAAQWPSMLTNPSSQPPAPPPMPAPPPALAPVSTFATAHSLPPLTTPTPPQATSSSGSSRRTLTDQDRRRMCQYHEDHPSVKQTEIGAMFGVERSTVSKVLRQKDKYLAADDGSKSPMKRPKGKFPDIERALSNWVRNHQRQGLPLDDNIIREKARFFATTVGSSDSHLKLNSTNWLEKFKQKNHLLGAKPRKSSGTFDSDAGLQSDPGSGTQTPSGISPISPLGLNSSISPISPSQSRDNLKASSPDSYLDFAANYKHNHSQSGTSLASAFTETTAPSSFSPQSPSSPFFSSDITSGTSPFMGSQHPHLVHAANDASRPRRQTFPQHDAEPNFGAAHPTGDSLTPKQMQELMSGPALETPIDEYPERSVSIASSGDGPAHSQSGSPAMMAPPPNPAAAGAPGNGSPTSPPAAAPSQDEARRALELVMHFFQHQPSGVVDPQEYITMGKLMEKLKVQGNVGELPGGMHSIELVQKEMSRKRSFHSL